MSAKNGIERELKFADAELDRLRERLLELSAERVAPSAFEENWIFDRKTKGDGPGELEKAGKLLRVRRDGQGAYLAYKGPADFEGRVKVRSEQETVIGDAETARSLLEALGYKVVRIYQKMREAWQLGGVVIALDHTPIGDFAEFEGEAADRLARRCGFEPEQAERRSYLRLYDDYRAEHPEAPPEMIFPDRA